MCIILVYACVFFICILIILDAICFIVTKQGLMEDHQIGDMSHPV